MEAPLVQWQIQAAEDAGLFEEPDDQFYCGICREDFRDGQKICKLGCGHKFHFQNLKQSLDIATKNAKDMEGVRLPPQFVLV